ncbi:Calcium load-activated calcium channel, partial [Mucuna pruriens]
TQDPEAPPRPANPAPPETEKADREIQQQNAHHICGAICFLMGTILFRRFGKPSFFVSVRKDWHAGGSPIGFVVYIALYENLRFEGKLACLTSVFVSALRVFLNSTISTWTAGSGRLNNSDQDPSLLSHFLVEDFRYTSMAYPFSDFKYSDGLTVVGISFCTAIVCEAISWVLIYRTNSYKNLRSSIDKASKKLETMKTDSNKINIKKSKTKKIDRVETSLKESSRDLSLFKFKSGGVVALVLFVVFGLLNSLFEGKVVAKLPFKPFGLIMKMSHRGLQGIDPTDCSMAFLYFLCSISIRTNLQKFLGFAPPRGASAGLFPMPDPKTNIWFLIAINEICIGHFR